MFSSLINFKERIKIIRIILDFESTRNLTPEVWLESSDEGSTLLCFGYAVIC
jgi:hypothetical protein